MNKRKKWPAAERYAATPHETDAGTGATEVEEPGIAAADVTVTRGGRSRFPLPKLPSLAFPGGLACRKTTLTAG